MSQNQFDDHALSQDAAKIGGIAEKAVDSVVKLAIEAGYFLYQQQQKKVQIVFDDPHALVDNTKNALAAGLEGKDLDIFMDKHSAVQTTAKRYPDQADKFKQDIISEAKQDLIVDRQRENQGFKQVQKQQQDLKQQHKQSQSQKM